MLSNNHVLANENDAEIGDEILQPGVIDGGRRREDVVGQLAAFTKLKLSSANAADCATATIDPQELSRKGNHLDGLGRVAGLGPSFLDSGEAVAKVGRTTGLTRGRVTAFEVDNVVVSFGMGQLSFNNQIEIEGEGADPFSAGGDSGSLIVDGDLRGIALLFAGTDQGGSNGAGLTYGAPLKVVLDQLKADLL